jgi:molecular chaperone HscB
LVVSLIAVEQKLTPFLAKVDAIIAKLTEAFSRNPPDLDAAKRLCVELKYWVSLEDAAKEKL